jgi:hypothetical protein
MKHFMACLLVTSIFTVSIVHAEEVIAGSVYDESKESEVVQKARRRIYPGGRDEGDLVVQSQLTAPTRKIAPQIEGSEHADD